MTITGWVLYVIVAGQSIPMLDIHDRPDLPFSLCRKIAAAMVADTYTTDGSAALATCVPRYAIHH